MKSIEFIPNDSLTSFQIGFQLLGDGTFYLDDFSVSRKVTGTEDVFTADFESEMDLYKVQSNPGTFSLDTTEKKDGTASLKAEFTSAWNQLGFGTFELKAGTVYTISYDWKITDYTQVDATQNAYSRLVTSGDVYGDTYGVFQKSDFQKSETDWTTVTYTYTPEEDITVAIYMEVGGGTATMWVDNLSVTKAQTVDVVHELFTADFEKSDDLSKIRTSPSVKLLDDTEKTSGNTSLKVEFASAWEQLGFGTFELKAGTTYTISYDWKITDYTQVEATQNAYSRLVESGAVYVGLKLSDFQTSETDWTTVTYTYTPEKDIKAAIYMEVGNGTATMWVDNLSVSYVTTEPVTEGQPVESGKVTVRKPGTASFDETADAWKIYTIPMNPGKVPGTEDETTFEHVKLVVGGTECEGSYQRADDSNGLCLSISSKLLPADADKVAITVKAGDYTSSDGKVSLKIATDYEMFLYGKNFYRYKGEVYHESDNGAYVIDVKSDNQSVLIDGVSVAVGTGYCTSGEHILTYTSYGMPYAMEFMVYQVGDVNEDGMVSCKDLITMKKCIQKVQTEDNISKAREKAADMDIDTNITDKDLKLLRRYQCIGTGLLTLSPADGQTVACANETVEKVVTDFTQGITEQYRTGKDSYYRETVILKWISGGENESYTVRLATTDDMKDAVEYKTNKSILEIENLLADQDYYWTVQTEGTVSEIQTFHTQDTVRTLTVDGVSNTRDCGGYTTTDGKTVKQGMFYRGGNLDHISEAGKTAMKNALKIKTDLDLRNSDETSGNKSPIGEDINYLNYSGPFYAADQNGIDAEGFKENLKNEILTFANKDNYPIYVHCSLGRDRTGTLCFLINAMLGVEETDLYLDYELSMLSSVASGDSTDTMNKALARLYNYLKTWAPDGTIQEATILFMKNHLGITDEEITTIRNLLLE